MKMNKLADCCGSSSPGPKTYNASLYDEPASVCLCVRTTTYNWRNVVTTLAPSFFILACNRDKHKNLDEFEFPPVSTTDYRVTCSCPLKINVSR